MRAKELIPVAISILTLIGGSGWIKNYLDHRRGERAASIAVLEGFLRPLESILIQNKRVHEALTRNQEFKNLEYAADYLQQHFASLPPDDSGTLAWKTLIEYLMEDNNRAVVLIQNNAGRILREDFRKACEDFVNHAKVWRAVWQATLGSEPVPISDRGPGKLIAPAFPEGMDALLELEIQARMKLAGK
jgi:hypothetical protein